MRPPIKGFWGKFDQSTGHWHPLIDHSADVAAVTESVLSRTLLGRRLARVAGFEVLDEVQIARLAFLAALHDLGKYQLGFQNQFDQAKKRRDRGHVGPALDRPLSSMRKELEALVFPASAGICP